MVNRKRKKTNRLENLLKSSKLKNEQLLFKLIIDSLIGGLLAIGIFFSSILRIEDNVEVFAVLGLFLFIFALITIFSLRFKKSQTYFSLLIIFSLTFVEVFFIGFILNEAITTIIIVWLIITPTILLGEGSDYLK